MKKFSLNVANLSATEILSRDQLKSIFGGSSGSGSEPAHCKRSMCKDNSDCGPGGGCASWSDCESDSKYGKYRCL